MMDNTDPPGTPQTFGQAVAFCYNIWFPKNSIFLVLFRVIEKASHASFCSTSPPLPASHPPLQVGLLLNHEYIFLG